MIKYTDEDLLRLAKRINNNKRAYLLVNPLQAKHIPVSPTLSLQMMEQLGYSVAKAYPSTRLVIAFAETATAIGAVVANCITPDCNYIHTTRENVQGESNWVNFLEEHSHAAEQKLAASNLVTMINATDTIVFVDDELSTGKTLINMVDQLRDAFPAMTNKQIVVASIINRSSEENCAKLKEKQIESICILSQSFTDYASQLDNISVLNAQIVDEKKNGKVRNSVELKYNFLNPRNGVKIGVYFDSCRATIDKVMEKCGDLSGKKILVLGTEECMLPALLIGKAIEDVDVAESVKCHATTRSPIGVHQGDCYPIQSGHQIHSFYDNDRVTFIYNISQCDIALIVSDSTFGSIPALLDLENILAKHGCESVLYMAGGADV